MINKTLISLGLIFGLLLPAAGLHAQMKTLTIRDTTARKGDTLLIPVRISTLTTGDSVYSAQATFSYNSAVLNIIGIETNGTLTQGVGSLLYNTTTRRLAFASTTILTGSGTLVYLRAVVSSSPTTQVDSVRIQSAQLNEGAPPLTIDNGYFRILATTLAPKNPPANLVPGDSVQFTASGDQLPPLIWSLSTPSIGSIDASGKLRTTGVGQLKVFVQDSRGLRDSSNLFAINSPSLKSLTLTAGNGTQKQTLYVNLPISISDVSSLGIYSGKFSLSFNAGQLQAIDIITAGTLTASWPKPVFNIIAGNIDIAFAGTTPLSGSGALLYVRFKVSNTASGSSTVSPSNVLFNEDINANTVNGTFTAQAAPTLVISPNSRVMTRNDTLTFIVASGGTPPYTWSSTNPAAALIDAGSGFLTALARGTTTINVIDALGFSTASGIININDLRIALPDTSVSLGDSIEVPIFTETLTGLELYAYETRIQYNSSIIRFRDFITTGTLSSAFTVTVRDTLDTLRVAVAGSSALSGGGQLLKLRFAPALGATNGQVSPLNFALFRFNEAGGTTPTATVVNGRLSIGLTPPQVPTPNVASGISSTGFTASWSSVNGATSYRVDVATNVGFSSIVTGYNDITVTGTGLNVTGLSANTSYYFRIRSVGAGGTSASSNTASVTTLQTPPGAPTALAASNITSNGFFANWNAVSGATEYRLDVSTDSTFTSIVTGYNNLLISTVTTYAVSGLSPNTTYYYRLRAANTGGSGASSNFIIVMTLTPPPAQPVAASASGITVSGFTARWSTVNGATGYQLDISSDNFVSFVSGYNAAMISDTFKVVPGLANNTIFYYRVRATNSGGASTNSNTITVTTLAAGSDIRHSIFLPSGWNMISSFLAPKDSTLDSLLIKIKPSLVILKNGAGQIYWPSFTINTIGNWKQRHGYQVYMTSSDTLSLVGQEVNPASNPLALPQGWNMISYLRNSPMRADSSLITLGGALVIAKNGAGQIYWPAFSINTMVNMKPGLGYQLYLSSTATLTYPANTSAAPSVVFSKRSAESLNDLSPQHYPKTECVSGSTAIVLVQGSSLNEGDEVGAWAANGLLIGSGVVQNGRCLITLWGDNTCTTDKKEGALPDETIRFTLWKSIDRIELSPKVSTIINSLTGQSLGHTLVYQTDGVWQVEFEQPDFVPDQIFLEQNYPNPFNPTTTIRYRLPQNGNVSLKIYNALGQVVLNAAEGEQKAGYYEVHVDARTFSSGIYFYTLVFGNSSETKKLIVLK
ncbi:MAG: cohesin domain-containing protein [bacterium]